MRTVAKTFCQIGKRINFKDFGFKSDQTCMTSQKFSISCGWATRRNTVPPHEQLLGVVCVSFAIPRAHKFERISWDKTSPLKNPPYWPPPSYLNSRVFCNCSFWFQAWISVWRSRIFPTHPYLLLSVYQKNNLWVLFSIVRGWNTFLKVIRHSRYSTVVWNSFRWTLEYGTVGSAFSDCTHRLGCDFSDCCNSEILQKPHLFIFSFQRSCDYWKRCFNSNLQCASPWRRQDWVVVCHCNVTCNFQYAISFDWETIFELARVQSVYAGPQIVQLPKLMKTFRGRGIVFSFFAHEFLILLSLAQVCTSWSR